MVCANFKGVSSNIPQKPETKPNQKPDTMLNDTNKSKDDNTTPVTPSGSNDSTPLTLVDNTSKSDDTQKQEPEVKTNKQKPINNLEKIPAEKTVKKHAKKSIKKGVMKTAKATETIPRVATVATTPVSNAKANKVVSTTATVKAPETKSDEKTLPQTGNEDNTSLIALGVIMIAFPSFVGFLVPKKKRNED